LCALVDTELWSIAKKEPAKEMFSSKEEFEKAMKMHSRAREFFSNEFPGLRVYISNHQLAEIFHVLAFRGLRIPFEEAYSIVTGIIEDASIVKVPLTMEHVMKALKESLDTGIHIWDFLCFLPVREFVDTIYSADSHFKLIGKRHGVKVINPLDHWLEI